MTSTTRNALFGVLVLMVAAMFYGYSLGTTPDYRATLAMIYGSFAGVASCAFLLIVLPLVDLLKRSAHERTTERAS